MPRLAHHRDAIIAAIVAELVPAEPPLDPAARETVAADVVAFVVSQVRALPDFLRLPYGLGLFAFEWLPMVRWGRPFRSLDSARRAAYVARWSSSRLGATRNFVKLLRSCTLLAYYDHPAVRARFEDASAAPLSFAGSA